MDRDPGIENREMEIRMHRAARAAKEAQWGGKISPIDQTATVKRSEVEQEIDEFNNNMGRLEEALNFLTKKLATVLTAEEEQENVLAKPGRSTPLGSTLADVNHRAYMNVRYLNDLIARIDL